MRFIVHVWTSNPRVTPWIVEWEEDGEQKRQLTRAVNLECPSWTRSSGHTPCADWYITGVSKEIRADDELVLIL